MASFLRRQRVALDITMIRKHRKCVTIAFVSWLLICGLNTASASTRRTTRFVGHSSLTRMSGGADVNETAAVATMATVKQEDTNISASSTRKRPLSGWFSHLNQRSIQNEEEQRVQEADTKEEENEQKNTTAASNTTAPAKWPQGRYWPTSPSGSQKERSPPASSNEADTDSSSRPVVSPVPEEADESTMEASKEEEMDSLTFDSPNSMDLFRRLGQRLRATNARDQDPMANLTRDDAVGGDSNAAIQEEIGMEPFLSSDGEVVPSAEVPDGAKQVRNVLSKIGEAATNAKSFFVQLPWQPQPRNRTATCSSDTSNYDAPTKLGSTEDHSTNEDHEHYKPETRVKVSDVGIGDSISNDADDDVDPPTIQQPVQESTSTLSSVKSSDDGAIGSSTTKALSRNPISIVRNLPWTPKGGKRYTVPTSKEPPHVKVNPIQFLLGLPWTPKRQDGDTSDGNSPSFDTTNEDDQGKQAANQDMGSTIPAEEEIVDTDTKERPIDGGSISLEATPDTVVTQPRASDETSASTDSGSKRQLTLSQEAPLVAEEESAVMAMEVEDVLSDYLLRQGTSKGDEDEEEEELMEHDGADGATADDDSESSILKAEENKMQDDFDQEGSDEKQKADNSPPGETPTLSLDSMVRRILGSFEQQTRSIEEKKQANESNLSNTTLGKKNATINSQISSDQSSDEESVPVTNKTSLHTQDQGGQQKELPPLPQQQQPTVIIMGGGPQDARALPTDLGRRPVPTPSLVLIEALATILGTAVRIWMISFLAKWWSEEETLRPVQHFVWERVNDRYLRDSTALQNVLSLPPAGVTEWKWRRYLRKQHRVEGKTTRKRPLPPQTFARTVVVVSIGPEMNIPHLEQAVTFLLSQHREQAFGSINGLAKELEVILLVDSPGGAVQDFGLAGAQVRRLAEETGVTTTACVDQIAASGGYMIASQADRIFASAFAIVGSIGVIREGINIHDALERHGIKGLVLKAGESKVPLTMFGQVTKSDLSKAQRTLDLMHDAFKEFVVRGRPILKESIDDVADGDVYFGAGALDQRLVDRIVTSEEYLLERIQAGDRVMKLHRAHQFVGRRKLFHPLDFLREKGAPLRSALSKWITSDTEPILTRAVAATSVVGVAQFLAQQRFFCGGGDQAR